MLATVMSSPNSRKRPAPGANPVVPTVPIHPQYSPTQPDNAFAWNSSMAANGFTNSASSNVTPYSMMPTQGQYGQGAQAPSTALTRRQNNRALVPSGNRASPFDAAADSWTNFGEDSGFLQETNGTSDENDNVEHLEERAARAKREAQAKRKQIPPFVQKLSSFLDESRNTDLIRWSEKGDSFIVLDEDEFAKTLIPELFKHNNYASFVRQLNMYGFHKRVGLSDNSMKASERKNKSPSEYYNPFFRRGHPNLLWLINKPKSGGKKNKAKKDEIEPDSDDDGAVEEPYPAQAFTTAPTNRVTPAANEVGPLQKKDLVQVKTQLERLQQQQVAISTMLNKLRQEHSSLYQQAVMFQSMHERHENSINAILNFLANVFRKSLEEQGGAHNVHDLLASIIPSAQGHGQNSIPQGSVVDLGDFLSPPAQNVTALNTPKRQQRLLPPIPHHQMAKSTSFAPSPSPTPSAQTYRQPQVGSVTELFDASPSDTTSPAYMKSELQNNPQEGMMKIIQDANAVHTPGIDLTNLTDVAANTPASMSNDQRNKMISIMAGAQQQQQQQQQQNSSKASPTPAFSSPPTMPTVPTPSIPPTTTAGITPNISSAAATSSGLSFPPVLSSIPPPSLQSFLSPSEFDNLQRLTEEQQTEIGRLSHLLGPLSPSGRIPGLDDQGNTNTSFFDSADFDAFINSSALSDPTSAAPGGGGTGGANYDEGAAGLMAGHGGLGGEDFNFSLDGNTTGGGVGDFLSAGNGGGYGNSPMGTPSPSHTEEITRNDLDSGGLVASPERDPKRRRRQ